MLSIMEDEIEVNVAKYLRKIPSDANFPNPMKMNEGHFYGIHMTVKDTSPSAMQGNQQHVSGQNYIQTLTIAQGNG